MLVPKELSYREFDLTKKILKKPDCKYSVVLFYANWCMHCTKFKPTYNKAANVLGSIVNVYSVNQEKQPELLKSFKINSFPTIMIFDKTGKYKTTYTGPRDSVELFTREILKLTK